MPYTLTILKIVRHKMYLTYTVYALIIALLIWGGKFAGFKKDQFHEDSSSLDEMKSLAPYP